MIIKCLQRFIFFVTLFSILRSSAYPAGFQVYNQDAAAAAMGNSFAAVADNGSAVFYNPAGINQLEGTQLRSGVHFVFPDTSFRSSKSGEKTEMHNDVSAPLMGYITHKVNDKVSIGGGLFTPYGLVTEWPYSWEGNTVATYSDLRTFFVNPVVSLQIHPRLSVAAGIDYVYADFKTRAVIDPNKMIGLPLGMGTGKITLKGSDTAWGFNLGLLFKLSERWKVGIAYRSKVKLNFDGRAKYHMPRVMQRYFPPTDISPRVELPPTLCAEISAHLRGKWTFATGILWTGWSVYNKLAPKFRDDLLIPDSMKSIPQEWRDVVAFHFGVQYQVNPAWVLRGGYIYDRSPVPEHTLGPMVPDADGHLFSAGAGYKGHGMCIDIACMASVLERRTTRRNISGLNGRYSSTGISLVISSTYYF